MSKAAIASLFLLGSLAGCSEGGAASRDSTGRIVDSSAGTVALGLGATEYRAVAVSQSSTLEGSITMQGRPADSVVAVTRDQGLCGDSASITRIESTGSGLANVLVWVEGISTGKPLPEVRRETLVIEDCRFVPRILAVARGTTINVLSRDRATMTSRFYREAAGEPVESIHTVDAGQLVPSERIAKEPGMVEARRTQHPWARGYIAVFDHPYFAVTDASGRFNIDALPAGTYTVKVWHERLSAPAEQRVVVTPGGAGRLDLALALQ